MNVSELQRSLVPTLVQQVLMGNLSAGNLQQSPRKKYSYLVKFIKSKRKSDFIVRTWHDVSEEFQHISSLKMKLMDSFTSELPLQGFQMGYFEHPNNAKRWLVERRDLEEMYAAFPSGGKITLWCEINDAEDDSHQKRRETSRERAEREVDEVFKQLKDKHQEMESAKLRLWAKLIHTGHHDDYDQPPNIPLITGQAKTSKPKKEGITEVVSGAATAIVNALNPKQQTTPSKSGESTHGQQLNEISPLKVVTLRRSCLDDLKRAKELNEDGVLTDKEFQEEKTRILSMLKGLATAKV